MNLQEPKEISASEQQPNQRPKRDCLDKFAFIASCSSFLLAIAAFIISLAILYSIREVQEKYFGLEKTKTASELIKNFTDESYPAHTKSLPLGTLLRRGLMEPELLFNVAYRHEDIYGPGALFDLKFVYAYYFDPIPFPIGNVDLPAHLPAPRDQKTGKFTIRGWGIDDKMGKVNVRVYLDDKLLFAPNNKNSCEIDREERQDIQKFFKKYKNLPLETGFKLECDIDKNKIGTEARLMIKLVDDEAYYMDILNAKVEITNTGIYRLYKDSEKKH